jgi:hypothetical protein
MFSTYIITIMPNISPYFILLHPTKNHELKMVEEIQLRKVEISVFEKTFVST